MRARSTMWLSMMAVVLLVLPLLLADDDDDELNVNPPTPCRICKRPPAPGKPGRPSRSRVVEGRFIIIIITLPHREGRSPQRGIEPRGLL